MGIDVEDMADEPIHMLLYGRNGIGKTTFACQFPKPLALVSIEMTKSGGARSVKKIKGITYFTYDEYKKRYPSSDLSMCDWVQQMGESLRGDDTFQSVVLDSGTALDAWQLAEICKWDEPAQMNRFGKVSGDQYTERSEKMRQRLRPYIELDKNVIIVCNEKDHNPSMDKDDKKAQTMIRRVVVETKEIQLGSYFAAAMGGGTTLWVQDACNYICQLYMAPEVVREQRMKGMGKQRKEITVTRETGDFIRRLRLKYHPNFSSRGRLSLEESQYENYPAYVEAKTPKEMYEKFIAVDRGEY